jgi:eukaryotic-like serine/threonine-protein kinase
MTMTRETAASTLQSGHAPRHVPFQLGTVLAGKYLLQQVIGEGGVGIVVLAKHLELDERVAIKFLRPEAMQDAAVVARFAHEAKASVTIKSEHVVRIFDVGVLPDGAPYIVMEHLEGKDLATAMEMQGCFAIRDVAEYGLQLCDALAAAHARGIVHRDIKPENIFLTSSVTTLEMTNVKVLDFGISKSALTGSIFGGAMPLVKTQNLMGTPLYMSPEQVRTTGHVDARSDIWALGMVLYEMLASRTAFDASSITELCAAILESPAAPLSMHRPDVPREMADVIHRCLEKDPLRRFQNVGELAIALLPFAPKRARINAERATSMLRSAGVIGSEIRVCDSTVPPRPSEANVLASSVHVPALSMPNIAPRGLGQPPELISEAPPPAKSRRGAYLAVAVAAVLLIAGGAFVVGRGSSKPIGADATKMVAAATPAPVIEPPSPPVAQPVAQAAPVQAAPSPGAAAATPAGQKAIVIAPVAAPARPTFVGNRGTWPPPRAPSPPSVPAVAARPAASPPVTVKPKNSADEPDLGY